MAPITAWPLALPSPPSDDAVMTDMTEHRDADTVIGAAIRDSVTDTAAVTMVTVEDAAAMAGVSVRTIRRWIQHGHLPHIEDKNGKRVSPADLPLAKERARHGHGHGHGTRPIGHDRRHDTMAVDTDTAMAAPALSSATAQLEIFRDTMLRPLVDRIEELSRENGRLEAERDQLRTELAAAQGTRQNAPGTHESGPQRGAVAAEAVETTRPAWRRWWRRVLGHAER
jgi:excisionase family DNA binding protein